MFFATRQFFTDYGFRNEVGLIAAFFLSVSTWHLFLSRIAFRGILAPLILTIAVGSLIKGIKTGSNSLSSVGALILGVGFYSYSPLWIHLVWIAPGVYSLVRRSQPDVKTTIARKLVLYASVFTAVILPLFVALIVRSGSLDHSSYKSLEILKGDSPFQSFLGSLLRTAGMLFFSGDPNWRHNYNSNAALVPAVAALFVAGLLFLGREIRGSKYNMSALLLIVWMLVGLFPSVVSADSPHARRAVTAIPAVMIISGYGATRLAEFAFQVTVRGAIRRLLLIAIVLSGCIYLTIQTGLTFQKWRLHPRTANAFYEECDVLAKRAIAHSSTSPVLVILNDTADRPFNNWLSLPLIYRLDQATQVNRGRLFWIQEASTAIHVLTEA